jgi:hypothetical protein
MPTTFSDMVVIMLPNKIFRRRGSKMHDAILKELGPEITQAKISAAMAVSLMLSARTQGQVREFVAYNTQIRILKGKNVCSAACRLRFRSRCWLERCSPKGGHPCTLLTLFEPSASAPGTHNQ